MRAKRRPVDVKQSNYDKTPVVGVPGHFEVSNGWPVICERLTHRLQGRDRAVLVVDTYPGVNDLELLAELEARLGPALTIRTIDLKSPEPELMTSIGRNMTDDRIFGVLSGHTLADFFNEDQLASARRRAESQRQ